MSGDEQWKGNGALGHKSCLTIELELRERIADLQTTQETEREISEDYKTKWHVALGEIERLKDLVEKYRADAVGARADAMLNRH